MAMEPKVVDVTVNSQGIQYLENFIGYEAPRLILNSEQRIRLAHALLDVSFWKYEDIPEIQIFDGDVSLLCTIWREEDMEQYGHLQYELEVENEEGQDDN